jgi:hypothetical protein
VTSDKGYNPYNPPPPWEYNGDSVFHRSRPYYFDDTVNKMHLKGGNPLHYYSGYRWVREFTDDKEDNFIIINDFRKRSVWKQNKN